MTAKNTEASFPQFRRLVNMISVEHPLQAKESEIDDQRDELNACLSFADELEESPKTLFLKTWLSAVNKMGVAQV